MLKNKRALSVISTTVITLMSALLISIPVQAATGDIYNIDVGSNLTTPAFTRAQTGIISNQRKIILGSANYGYEVNGQVFKFNDFATEFMKLGYAGAITSISKDMTAVGTVTPVSSLTVSSVSAINDTKNVGDVYTLPVTVTATLSDGTNKDLAVIWDKVASTGVAGTYTFTGTLTMINGVVNTNNVKVSATLIVQAGAIIDSTIATFPDKALEAIIRASIQKPTGDILKSDVEKITSLQASKKNITNLSGMENLTNLTSLDLSYNQISNVEALKGLICLTSLNLNNNQISNISALGNLKALKTLSLFFNQISDISVLGNFKALTSLEASRNQISDISVLGSLKALNSLSIAYNQIKNIESLRELSNLGMDL